MMKDIKMKYGNFEFPSNPQTISADFSIGVKTDSIINKTGVTQRAASKPAVISGSGRFYGKDAGESCSRLSFMMKSEDSFWLFCPGIYPIKAYLSQFSYQLDCAGQGASYAFTFTEDCAGKAFQRTLLFTVAKEDENAFDIADRCRVSVDDIMRLNDMETPFDITPGRRIRINENTDD